MQLAPRKHTLSPHFSRINFFRRLERHIKRVAPPLLELLHYYWEKKVSRDAAGCVFPWGRGGETCVIKGKEEMEPERDIFLRIGQKRGDGGRGTFVNSQ